ncbi:MAG: transcriptional repressor [Planctomycetota bacterium]|nr:transcriptional repressor [Planctomycetota bacterium]MDW8373768.1 transcriptional repressor [Planctomycetota bacterium]
MPKTRDTPQRRAIAAVLERAEGPLSVHDILQRAQREVPRLGIATVYRVLAELRRARAVVSVEVAGHPVCYEATRRAHHHHFHCRRCRTLYDVGGCVAELASLLPRGFQLEDHEIVLRGLCARCAPLSPAAPSGG